MMEFKNQIEKLSTDNNTLIAENQKLKKQFHESFHQFNDFHEQTSLNQQNEYLNFKTELTNKNKKNDLLKKKLNAIKKKYNSAENNYKKIIQDSNNEIQMLKCQSDQTISEIKNQLIESRKENRILKEKNEDLLTKIRNKHQKIQSLKDELKCKNSCQTKSLNNKITLMNSNIEKLKEENKELKENLLEQQNNMKINLMKCQESFDMMENLSKENKSLNKRINSLANENKKNNKVLFKWKENYQILKNKLDKAEDTIALYQSIIQQSQDKNKNISSMYEKIKYEKDQLVQNSMPHVQKINKFEKIIHKQAKMIEKLKQTEYNKIKIDKKNVPDQIYQQIDKIANDTLIDSCAKINCIVMTIVNYFQKQNIKHECSVENQSQIIDGYKQQIENFRKLIQELIPDLNIFNDKHIPYHTIKEFFSEKENKYREDIELITNEKLKLEKQIHALFNMLNVDSFSKAKNEIIKLQNTNKSLNITICSLNESINSLNTKIVKIKDEISELRDQNEKLYKENEIANSIIADLNQDKRVLVDARIAFEEETKKRLENQKELYQKLQESTSQKIKELCKEARSSKEKAIAQSELYNQTAINIESLNKELNDVTEKSIEYLKQIQDLKQKLIEQKSEYEEKLKCERTKSEKYYSNFFEKLTKSISNKKIKHIDVINLTP